MSSFLKDHGLERPEKVDSEVKKKMCKATLADVFLELYVAQAEVEKKAENATKRKAKLICRAKLAALREFEETLKKM